MTESQRDQSGAVEAPVPETRRPLETAKECRIKIANLDSTLAGIHQRLEQTEKQIYDLERSYLEDTRPYGNVIQGWDVYLDMKGKSMPGKKRPLRVRQDADAAGGGGSEEAGEGAAKRSRGVALEERLFSLGSVTSPATRGLAKVEGKVRGVKQADAGAGGSRGAKDRRSPKKTGMKGGNKSTKKLEKDMKKVEKTERVEKTDKGDKESKKRRR